MREENRGYVEASKMIVRSIGRRSDRRNDRLVSSVPRSKREFRIVSDYLIAGKHVYILCLSYRSSNSVLLV